MGETDWAAWHAAYERPDSGLGSRLGCVQAHISRRLDATSPAPIRVVSVCAGDGRDLLDVLERRSDADRVSGLLVEIDEGLAGAARDRADRLTGGRLEVRCADAACSRVYADAAPAHLVLMCGIFGNIRDDDVHGMVGVAPQLCAPGAEVIWTRHHKEPDLTPAIRRWFSGTGFEEVAFDAPADSHWSVGVHRLTSDPAPLDIEQHWFTFFR